MVTVHPAKNVKQSVKSQQHHVVRPDVFNFVGLAHHVQLRQDGEGFHPDREGPQEVLIALNVAVDKQGQDKAERKDDFPVWETIEVLIVGLFINIGTKEWGFLTLIR